MKWLPEKDVLGLNYNPMNLEKKVRGAKKTARLDVTNPDGLRTAFQNGLMTRAVVLGRVAEFYDPVGWFEPLKLQMKLLLSGLNGLDWHDRVPDEFVEPWIELFTLMEGAREIRIPDASSQRTVQPKCVSCAFQMPLTKQADAPSTEDFSFQTGATPVPSSAPVLAS